MIKVDDLRKVYPGAAEPAVDGVTFTVEEGSFYTLLGPSGCGKTTTLRCTAGLERADGGTIQLGDTVVQSDRATVPTHRRDIGMVFQSYAIWPHLTVFENVAFPLRVGRQRLPSSQLRARVESALELVGLGGLEGRLAPHLSGGQQQRLSLARAIVREPSVLLLDEPLSNLDAKLRARMRSELSVIQRRLEITTLFVTHDQVEALSMSDRIGVMRQGRIIQEGTPREIYHHPVNQFVSSFIGSTNLIPGRVEADAADTGTVTADTADGGGTADSAAGTVGVRTTFGRVECTSGVRWEPGDEVVVAIRPEDVVLHRSERHPDTAPDGNVYPAAVRIGLFTGDCVEYQLEVGDVLVQAQTASRITLARGDKVHVELPAHACQVFAGREPEAAASGEVTTVGDVAAIAGHQAG